MKRMKLPFAKATGIFGIGFLLIWASCSRDSLTNSINNNAETMTDADGNVYSTVKIGKQVWMAENLRTTKFNDGSAIPRFADSTALDAPPSLGYCYYNNMTNADSIKKFGALYNWYTVNTKKLSPTGWHVPADSEWDTLQNYLIVNRYTYDGSTTDNEIAKSLAAKTDWKADSLSGTIGDNLPINNSSGFSALPSGWRYCDGPFDHIGSDGYWWTATASDKYEAYYRVLGYDLNNLQKGISSYCLGFSVRLVKD
jgi:uncharacterized protein (TIGR02145 family)